MTRGYKYTYKPNHPNIGKRFCNLCNNNKTTNWYIDINGFLCHNCFMIIRYYRNILFGDKYDRFCNLCKTDKTKQWYNDINGYLCRNCYLKIRCHQKKFEKQEEYLGIYVGSRIIPIMATKQHQQTMMKDVVYRITMTDDNTLRLHTNLATKDYHVDHVYELENELDKHQYDSKQLLIEPTYNFHAHPLSVLLLYFLDSKRGYEIVQRPQGVIEYFIFLNKKKVFKL